MSPVWAPCSGSMHGGVVTIALAEGAAAAEPVRRAQVWTAERSTQLGLAVASMLKNYTTTAAKYTGLFIKSVAKFGLQVGARALALRMAWRKAACCAGFLFPAGSAEASARTAMPARGLHAAVTALAERQGGAGLRVARMLPQRAGHAGTRVWPGGAWPCAGACYGALPTRTRVALIPCTICHTNRPACTMREPPASPCSAPCHSPARRRRL